MNNLQKTRLIAVSCMAVGLSLAAGLILFALKKNINVFLTPSQITLSEINSNFHFRLGGMVKKNSLSHKKDSLKVTFIVTDLKKEIVVHYNGVLPDLFREEKGVIAEGYLDSQSHFHATQVLAKHDENYMPKKVYQALRENQHA